MSVRRTVFRTAGKFGLLLAALFGAAVLLAAIPSYRPSDGALDSEESVIQPRETDRPATAETATHDPKAQRKHAFGVTKRRLLEHSRIHADYSEISRKEST